MKCPYCGSELIYNPWDCNWFCEFDEVPIEDCDAIDDSDDDDGYRNHDTPEWQARQKLLRWNKIATRWNERNNHV
jgi:hypothetical protein